MRNLTNAASQIPYRACARYLRSNTVMVWATATKTVDCQRWFATAVPMLASRETLNYRSYFVPFLSAFSVFSAYSTSSSVSLPAPIR